MAYNVYHDLSQVYFRLIYYTTSKERENINRLLYNMYNMKSLIFRCDHTLFSANSYQGLRHIQLFNILYLLNVRDLPGLHIHPDGQCDSNGYALQRVQQHE